MKTISLDDLFRSGGQPSLPRHPPSMEILLTYRCNLACNFCFCNLPAGDPQARRRELTAEQWFPFFEEFARRGTIRMNFTGGECHLHPDYERLYERAFRLFRVSVFTNGLTLSDGILQMYREKPPIRLEITVYGVSNETYGRVTGHPHGWDVVSRSVDRVLEAGINLELKTTVSRENAGELLAVRRYADRLGLFHRYDTDLVPRSDGRPNKLLEVRLNARERRELAELYSRTFPEAPPRKHTGTEDETCDLSAEEKQPEPDWDSMPALACPAGKLNAAVDPYGRMMPCVLFPTRYDLRRGSLEGFYGYVETLRSLQVKDPYAGSLDGDWGRCPAKTLLVSRAGLGITNCAAAFAAHEARAAAQGVPLAGVQAGVLAGGRRERR